MACVRVRVEGRVQGVAYRAWVEDQARELGITGWVRNRSDGSVEALICGEEAATQRLLARMGDGPQAASVSAVRVLDSDGDAAPADFTVRPTV